VGKKWKKGSPYSIRYPKVTIEKERTALTNTP
jgi:hypothetical protein